MKRPRQKREPQSPGTREAHPTSSHYNSHPLFRPVKPGTSFSFELTQKQGAALITKHPTFREDIDLEAAFEDYTERHYNSWVAFARNKRCGNDIKPILVSGVDMTKDFAMMAYSNDGTGRSCKFVVSVPIADSGSASVWGNWKAQGVVHTNCGPLCSQREALGNEPPDIDAMETPENYNHCVFVRYYTMRFRTFVPPKVTKAEAGPHDLGLGENHDGTPPKLTMQSSLDSEIEADRGGDLATDRLSSATGHDFERISSVCQLLPLGCQCLLIRPGRKRCF